MVSVTEWRMKMVEVVAKMHRNYHNSARAIRRDKKLQKELAWCKKWFLKLYDGNTEADFDEMLRMARIDLPKRLFSD